MPLSEEKISSREIYRGRILTVTVDTVRLENGKEAPREVVHHSGGVCVVPLDGDGNIYLVRQFRYPHGKALLEIPAGKLEPGEDHRECGLRELAEEIGAAPESLEYLGEIYPTTAYLTEVIHLYAARGLKFTAQSLDEDEFLDVVKMPACEARRLVLTGKIPDAKTQIGILRTIGE